MKLVMLAEKVLNRYTTSLMWLSRVARSSIGVDGWGWGLRYGAEIRRWS